MMPAEITTFIRSTRGVTQLRIERLVVCARLENPGKWDGELIDNKKAANPYESWYGNEWKDKISKPAAIKANTCVTQLVELIFHATAKIVQGKTPGDT